MKINLADAGFVSQKNYQQSESYSYLCYSKLRKEFENFAK